MKYNLLLAMSYFLLFANNLHAQSITLDKNNMEPINVSMSVEKLMSRQVVKVIKDSTIQKADEPTYARIKGVNFKNGTIEVKVLSRWVETGTEGLFSDIKIKKE